MLSRLASGSLSPTFVRLAWSNAAAQAAQQIGMAAVPLAAVLILHADVADVGMLQIAQTLPYLLFTLPAGVLADRMSRLKIMRTGELLRCLSLALIPMLALAGWMNVGVFALAAFIGTLGSVAYSVAVPSLIPALVKTENLATANSRIELARSTAYISGPALAGALVAWTGANMAFGMAAVLSMLAVWLMARLPEPERSSSSNRNFTTELRDGAIFVWRHKLLRPMLIITIIFNVGFFILQTTYIPYAAHTLGLSSVDIGFTLAAYGVGMAIAALGASRISQQFSTGAMLIMGLIISLAGCAMLLATIWIPSFWLAAACYLLMGMGPVIWTGASTTLRQLVTPAELLGRVSAINTMSVYGARPLGALIAGAVGQASGMQSCLWLVAAVFTVQMILFACSPLPRQR